MKGKLLFGLVLMAAILPLPVMAAETVRLSIDASKTGAKIDRNIFGQFAENLGHGLYEGIWVGPESPIPNTRGIRSDVVAALKDIKVPNVRWPGGCFADQYHWRKGIGPAGKRPATLNTAWGNVVDTNSFGTDEFMDFIQQIGSQPYVSVNVGSGTPQEAAEWLEYMTAAAPTALQKERAANGHPGPYKVGFMGIGNESWSCGGDMTADNYVSQLKIYSRFVENDNPDQQSTNQMLKIAVGPGFPETEWTDTVMKAWQHHDWSWNFDGLSVHWYTTPGGWPLSMPSTDFSVDDYATTLKTTLFMDEFLRKQEAVMDKYDPQKKVALVVDEWGGWYKALPGTNKDFLLQQNSIRDAILASLNLNIFARHADRVRMANIAQMINVIQAMILTDKEKMVLTPTYYVFKMYVPFQDATFIPVAFDAGAYTHGGISLPRIDAIAAKGTDGKLWVEITNLDAENPITIDADLTGITATSASAETLTGAAVDSINTFALPNTVVPKATAVKIQDGKLSLTVAPRSVTIVSMYSSSATTGDFENYIARDVVAYMDAHYRTIPSRQSRGLVGHSMGGYGASRIGMKHPEVFGALYIMSPCCMSPMAGGGPGPASQMKDRAIASEKKVADAKSPADLAAQSPGFASAQYATAAAWAPDPKNPLLYFDLPTKDGVPVPEIVAKFTANSPLSFVDQYIGNLKQYRAIAMDVGDQDGLRFDATKLRTIFDNYGIANSFEIYSGTHTSAVADRFQNHVLPFFSKNLCFTADCR